MAYEKLQILKKYAHPESYGGEYEPFLVFNEANVKDCDERGDLPAIAIAFVRYNENSLEKEWINTNGEIFSSQDFRDLNNNTVGVDQITHVIPLWEVSRIIFEGDK